MFGSYGTGNTNEGKKSDIDYDALNKYVIETAACESPEVLVGVVAGIVDLGIQEQNDAEIVFTGTVEDEADIIDDKPDTYFIDGVDPKTKKPCRFKCYPQRAIQSIAMAIEFPEIQIDKGKFFGDTSGTTKSLRVFLGGQFYNTNTKKMQIARPTPLKIGKNPKNQWSFNNLHICHKMAVAAKLITPDAVFLPQDIDKLVGQAFQFELQIFNKESKGKSYYTEKVAFKSGLGRGQTAPELPTETFIIQFNEKNDEKMLKEVRAHVLSTIRAAKNFEGSPIQKQLDVIKSSYSSNPKVDDDSSDDVPDESVKAPVKVATTRKPKVIPMDDMDDDIPF